MKKISINKTDYNTDKLAVTLLHFDANANVLAVSRKNNFNDFGLVGGKVEDTDANLLDAIIRETKEETGLIITDAEPIFVREEKENGYTSITFIAHEIDGDISTNESGIVKYVDFSEICNGTFGEYNKSLQKHYYDKL